LAFELTGRGPETESAPEGTRVGSIRVRGRATWTGKTVLVEARAQAEVSFTCSRCLQPFARPVEADFVREFRPEGDGPARTEDDEAVEGENQAEKPDSFDGDSIDLSFPAWEAVVLELPMKPVCRPDCAGLCPVCGTDLNTKTCGCQADEADPRFLPLRKLLEPKERGD